MAISIIGGLESRCIYYRVLLVSRNFISSLVIPDLWLESESLFEKWNCRVTLGANYAETRVDVACIAFRAAVFVVIAAYVACAATVRIIRAAHTIFCRTTVVITTPIFTASVPIWAHAIVGTHHVLRGNLGNDLN